VEFADYREYAPGDDFRYVDWNIYGRLGRLLVKTFVQEVDVPVYFLLDLSSSMRLGRPEKAHYASQLVLALGYLALRSLDRVGLFPFSDHMLEPIPARHGMAQFGRFLRLLSGMDPEGQTSISRGIDGLLTHTRESGLVILVSDFLTTEDLQESIGRLQYRGDEVIAVQVLDRDDLAPTLSGPVQFVDVETDARTTLSVGATTLASYRKAFEEFEQSLRQGLAHRGVQLFVTRTDRALERVIHEDLRAGGVLR
jgi:uncharacterized protein (DUF58 family)